MILAALVERNDIAAQTGLVERFLFDLGRDGAPGEKGLLGGQVRFDRRIHTRRHILDAHEHVEFEVEAALLLGGCAGMETVAHVIVVLVAEFLEGVGADVMVGDDEALRGDERAGAAAVEADGRFLDVLEPRVGHVEAVFFLELFARRIIEQPHAFIRVK